MAKITKAFSGTTKTEKPYSKGRGFAALMSQIPVHLFDRMVMKAGMPTHEARELCAEFRSLKK